MNKIAYLKKNILSLPQLFIVAMVFSLLTFMGTGVALADTPDMVELRSPASVSDIANLQPTVIEMPSDVQTETDSSEIILDADEEGLARVTERNYAGCQKVIVYPIFVNTTNGQMTYYSDLYRGAIYGSLNQFNSYTIPSDFYNAVLNLKLENMAFVGWKVDPYFLVESYNPLRIEYYRTDDSSNKRTISNLFSGDSYVLTYLITDAYFEEENAISGALYFTRSNNTSGSSALSMVIDK